MKLRQKIITTSEFCKKEYGEKLYKICFDAHLGCPNRDGKCGTGGCIFCSEGGSGDFAVSICNPENCRLIEKCELDLRIEEAKEKVSSKYKGSKYIAYFQAYSNTYADVSCLRDIYFSIINREDIAVLSIATRPDCFSEDIFELIKELNNIKPVWIELGLQTTKESTIEYIRRGYNTSLYDEVVRRLVSIGVHVITHVILYLPGESEEDMLNTVLHVADSGSQGIKLQLLHVLKNTDLAEDYNRGYAMIDGGMVNITTPTLDEYIETLAECLKRLPSDMVVHRMTGDPPKKLLIEPKWSADKKRVINEINRMLNSLVVD